MASIVFVEYGRANWEPIAGHGLEAPDGLGIRTQWCHGAPGTVGSTLAGIALHDDDAFRRLLWPGAS